MEDNNIEIIDDTVVNDVPTPNNGNVPVDNSINPVNEIANVANETSEIKVDETTNEDPTNELQNIAQMSYNKQAPNIDLGNKPIEQPKEETIEVVEDQIKPVNDNSQVIGTIKPDKQKSPVAMLVLFGILIGFIIFMPEAVKKFNEYFGTDFSIQDGVYIQETNDNNVVNSNSNTNTNTNINTNTNTSSNLKLYDLSETLTINVDKLVLSDFKKINDPVTNNYYINISIKNTDSAVYTFTNKLYIDFYNKDGVFIDRILIDNKEIPASSVVQFRSVILKDIFDNGIKVEALFRSGDDYPKATLTNNTLTCTKDNRTILFNFKDNKLTGITDTTNYYKLTDLAEYTNLLMNSKNIISNMDMIDGVNAVLTENENGFMTRISVNYNTANYDTLTYKEDYYKKDTLDSEINFELKAKNYTCS